MSIIAQCGKFYLLTDAQHPERDLSAPGEIFNARTGQRAPAFVHRTLKQGYWGPWDGQPVPGLPESQPTPQPT